MAFASSPHQAKRLTCRGAPFECPLLLDPSPLLFDPLPSLLLHVRMSVSEGVGERGGAPPNRRWDSCTTASSGFADLTLLHLRHMTTFLVARRCLAFVGASLLSCGLQFSGIKPGSPYIVRVWLAKIKIARAALNAACKGRVPESMCGSTSVQKTTKL